MCTQNMSANSRVRPARWSQELSGQEYCITMDSTPAFCPLRTLPLAVIPVARSCPPTQDQTAASSDISTSSSNPSLYRPPQTCRRAQVASSVINQPAEKIFYARALYAHVNIYMMPLLNFRPLVSFPLMNVERHEEAGSPTHSHNSFQYLSKRPGVGRK